MSHEAALSSANTTASGAKLYGVVAEFATVDALVAAARKVTEAAGHTLGATVESRVSTLCTDPWTLHVQLPGHTGEER